MKEFKYLKTFESFDYKDDEKLNESLEKKWNKNKDFDPENVKEIKKAFRNILGGVTKTDYVSKRWDKYFIGKEKEISNEEKKDMVKILKKIEKAVEKGAKRVSLVGSKTNSLGMDVAFDRPLGSIPELK